MSRSTTGAMTTDECMRLEVSRLQQLGLIKKGCYYGDFLSWTNGGGVLLMANYRENEMYLDVSYSTRCEPGADYRPCNYKIKLDVIPSNLGKGEIVYFICPETGKRCKVLYAAYGKPKFMCREAFDRRIYYPLQLASKRSIYNDRFWQLERNLEPLLAMRDTNLYKGKITRRAQRIDRLIDTQNKMDGMRFSLAGLPKRFRKEFEAMGYKE